jgi:hypothetical protein
MFNHRLALGEGENERIGMTPEDIRSLGVEEGCAPFKNHDERKIVNMLIRFENFPEIKSLLLELKTMNEKFELECVKEKKEASKFITDKIDYIIQ